LVKLPRVVEIVEVVIIGGQNEMPEPDRNRTGSGGGVVRDTPVLSRSVYSVEERAL
jgi:hypothetical protein